MPGPEASDLEVAATIAHQTLDRRGARLERIASRSRHEHVHADHLAIISCTGACWLNENIISIAFPAPLT